MRNYFSASGMIHEENRVAPVQRNSDGLDKLTSASRVSAESEKISKTKSTSQLVSEVTSNMDATSEATLRHLKQLKSDMNTSQNNLKNSKRT
jgi:IMP dehydrogenase/GMP reductase